MSKTPRVDEYAGMSGDFRCLEVVSAKIAREIEIELADKNKLIKQMYEALHFLRETQAHKALHGKDSEYVYKRCEAWTKCGLALDAAERIKNNG